MLQNINDQFAPLLKKFCVFFFWEQQKTSLGPTRDYVTFPRPFLEARLIILADR